MAKAEVTTSPRLTFELNEEEAKALYLTLLHEKWPRDEAFQNCLNAIFSVLNEQSFLFNYDGDAAFYEVATDV